MTDMPAPAPGNAEQILVMDVAGRRFGLAAANVERVIHAVDVAPLPDAPEAILGVINVHGTPVPVIDLRVRLSLSRRSVGLRDRFALVRTPLRLVAVAADAVEGTAAIPEDAVADAAPLVTGACLIRGIAAAPGGLVYLYDADALLSPAEAADLAEALSRAEAA